jgi:predicted RND superfamily exporter protein
MLISQDTEHGYTATHSAEPNSRPTGASRSIAYGLERIGLISLRFPLLVGLVSVVLLVATAFGIARIKVDDSLSQLFRSETPEFRTFDEVTRRFPSNEFDVLIVVEGNNLLARESIEKVRGLVTDLQLIEGTRGIILFSAREPPQAIEVPAPLFPDQLPTGRI